MCHIVVLVQFTGPGGLKVSSGLCCQIHNHRARLHPVNHCLETEFFQSQINNNKHAIIDNSLVDSQKYKSLSIFTKFKIWSLSFANKSRNKKFMRFALKHASIMTSNLTFDTSLGAGLPGTRAVVMTTSHSSHCLAYKASFLSRLEQQPRPNTLVYSVHGHLLANSGDLIAIIR